MLVPMNHSNEAHKLALKQLYADKVAAKLAAENAAKRAAYLAAKRGK